MIGSLGVILDTADSNPEIINEPGFASDLEDLFGELGTLVGSECPSPELAGSAMSEVLVYLVSQQSTRSIYAGAFIGGVLEGLCGELEGVVELTFEGRAACLTAHGDGGTSVFDLVVGDCFNDDPVGGDAVSEVPTVDCSQPHDNEVYFEFSMTDAAFPGQEQTRTSSSERCIAEFEGFVGMSYAQSDLNIFPITPTAESWDQGDRVVYCALYALDLSKLTGSMRGAAR